MLVTVASVIILAMLLAWYILSSIAASRAPISKKIKKNVTDEGKVAEGEVNFDRASSKGTL